MVGQGSPGILSRIAHAVLSRVPCALRRLCPILVGVIVCALVTASDAAAADPTVLLRFSWGGDPSIARQWRGQISVDKGSAIFVRALGTDADEPGSVWTDGDHVEFRARSPKLIDGAEVEISAPLDAILSVNLGDALRNDAPISSTKITISELLDRPFTKSIDKAGDRLTIRRAPGDQLRVTFNRDNLIFAPGDPLQFDLEPKLLPTTAGTSLQIMAKIVSADGAVDWSSQEQQAKTTAQETTPPIINWQFKSPEKEGVYDLIIEAQEPPALRWNKPKLIAERHVQFVVLNDQVDPAFAMPAGPWQKVMELDPANPAWYERVRSLLPGASAGPFGNGDLLSWQHPTLGPMVQLPGNSIGADPHWEAYPLSVGKPGAPHILEIEYPSDIPQSLGVTLIEPNAAGAVESVGVDSGFFTPDEASTVPSKMLRHRIIFWPKTKSPIVLICNRRDSGRAVFAKIKVWAGPSKLPRAFAISDLPERILAGYLRTPLSPEIFGSLEPLDSSNGRPIRDWQTYYQSASRLAEYLNYIGDGGQMLTVMSDGSTIYPSKLIEPTPKYDNSINSELAQDPVRKDALELTLQLFDREKLKLIPTFKFNARLPQLEALIRAGGPDSDGIELLGPDGAPYNGTPARFSKSNLYNPLDERVQDAVLAVVREAVQRYHRHPSFAGAAIELSADTFTQLPGELYGLDDRTISQFEKATGMHVPGDGASRFSQRAQFFSTPQQAAAVGQGNLPRDAWVRCARKPSRSSIGSWPPK